MASETPHPFMEKFILNFHVIIGTLPLVHPTIDKIDLYQERTFCANISECSLFSVTLQ